MDPELQKLIILHELQLRQNMLYNIKRFCPVWVEPFIFDKKNTTMEIDEFNKLSKEEQLKVKYKNLPKRIRVIQFVMTVVIVIVLITCVGNFVSSDESSTDGVDTTFLYVRSETMAKKFVKETLISPSSAKFINEDFNIWLFPDSTVVVKLSVDAQNAFGVFLRDRYYLKMKWRNDFAQQENWMLINIQNNQ